MKAIKACAYLFISCVTFTNVFGQINYKNGNAAYVNEKNHQFRDVMIDSGDMIYQYDEQVKQYRCGEWILIPDLIGSKNGHSIHKDDFFGYGSTTKNSDTAFQWDRQTHTAGISLYDVNNMFVSPVSKSTMTFGKAIQNNISHCHYQDCPAIIDGPDSSLAYPTPPASDTFFLFSGEELVNAGDIKGTGTSMRVSQQQLKNTPNAGYCVKKYGEGWRLPTDLEVGHLNDNTGYSDPIDVAYQTINNHYLWTSSLFITYEVKRWVVYASTGNWENCNGFLYYNNNVRCVFPGYSDSVVESDVPGFQLKAFPVFDVKQPVRKHFLEITASRTTDCILMLHDVHGKKVHQHQQTLNKGMNNCLLDQPLSPGVYMLSIKVAHHPSYHQNIKLIMAY